MHVHLPKAFHGWREFAKEVGIIVLGVLIALGFEQIVQIWHWHEEVRTTRSALTNELVTSALWAEERLAVQRCLHDRVAHLVTKLNSGASTWTSDPMILGNPTASIGTEAETAIPVVYRTPHRPWLSDEWETAKSTGAVDHMDREEVRNFEFIFRSVNDLRAYQDEETALEPQISFLSFTQVLDPVSRVQAVTILARLDHNNGLQVQMARQLLSAAATIGLPFGTMRIGPRRTSFADATTLVMTALRQRYGTCVINPPPLRRSR